MTGIRWKALAKLLALKGASHEGKSNQLHWLASGALAEEIEKKLALQGSAPVQPRQ